MRRIFGVLWLVIATGCAGGSSGPAPIGGGGPKGAFVLNDKQTFDVTFGDLSDEPGLLGVDPRVLVDRTWVAASDYAHVARADQGDQTTWTFTDPTHPTMRYVVDRDPVTGHFEVRMEVSGAPGQVVDGFEVLATRSVRVAGLRDVLLFGHNGHNDTSFSGVVSVDRSEKAARRADGGIAFAGDNIEASFPVKPQGWWWGTYAAEAGTETILAGAVTTETWKTAVVGELEETGRAALWVINGTQGDHWDLGRGPARSEVVFLGSSADYVGLCRDYAQAIGRHKPAMTWTGPIPRIWSSWYARFRDVGLDDLVRNAGEIFNDPRFDPINVIELGQGYESAWGDWLVPNDQFPDDLGAVADAITESGWVPGIWLAPLVVDDRSTVYQEHPEWVLPFLQFDGPVICPDIDCSLEGSEFFGTKVYFALDITRPEVQAFVGDTIETLQDLGFHYLHLDFALFAAHEGRWSAPGTTTMSAFQTFLDVVHARLQANTFLEVSGAPILPIVGGAHATRAGPDVLHEIIQALPGVFGPPSHVGYVSMARNFMARFFLNPGLIWLDPDAMIARPSLTDDELRAAATLEGMVGGIYSIGEELTTLGSDRRAILTNPDILALSHTRRQAVPLDPYDAFDRRILDEPIGTQLQWNLLRLTEAGQPQRWHLDAGDGVHYVALFNWRDERQAREARLGELGLMSARRVVDVWTGEDAVVGANGAFGGSVPAHGVRLYRVEE
ncbi:MAG: alpha-galactosidase [Myxococcales bacterium]|nr:alpha-galactosidase [Myxococcales bacterium]